MSTLNGITFQKTQDGFIMKDKAHPIYTLGLILMLSSNYYFLCYHAAFNPIAIIVCVFLIIIILVNHHKKSIYSFSLKSPYQSHSKWGKTNRYPMRFNPQTTIIIQRTEKKPSRGGRVDTVNYYINLKNGKKSKDLFLINERMDREEFCSLLKTCFNIKGKKLIITE